MREWTHCLSSTSGDSRAWAFHVHPHPIPLQFKLHSLHYAQSSTATLLLPSIIHVLHFSSQSIIPIHPSLSDKFTRSHSLPSLSISFWSATIHLHFYTSVLTFHNHYSSIVIIIRLSLHSRLSYSSPFSLHDLIFLSTTITLFDTWDPWTTERTFLDLRRFNHFFSFPLIQQTIALLLKFISFLLSSISLPRSLPLPSWLASSLHS